MIFERSILLAKIESVYAVNPTPTAADDAFITSVPVVTPLGDHRERNVARAGFAMPGGINVGQGVQVEFSVELRGTDGTGDEPPKIGRLFRACGMLETITSLVEVVYTPRTTHDGDSVALIVNYDGTQHLILGCRGTFTIDFNNNDVVMVNFTFTGKYSQPTAVAFPAGTFEDTVERLVFRGASLSLNSVTSLIFENIAFNPNMNVFRRPGSSSADGTHAYSIVGRAAEASIEPEAVALATFDPFDLYTDSNEFDVSWQVQDAADTPGQQWTFNMYNCQIKEPATQGQRESIRTWPITVKSNGTIEDGNDDFDIICSLPSES